MEPDSFAEKRRLMVQQDIAGRGIIDPRVLDAMGTVRREQFVDPAIAEFAYADRPLPIGSKQTISQPFIVAVMAEAAEIGAHDAVLEVGAGSGYGAAVLGCLARSVVTVERHHTLAERARACLAAEGFETVTVIEGDGTLGYPAGAPYDAIVVTAGGPEVPEALREQLADGGRLIMPVGPIKKGQTLLRIRREGERFSQEQLGEVRFVPLVEGVNGRRWR